MSGDKTGGERHGSGAASGNVTMSFSIYSNVFKRIQISTG
jgi:hypothetical protein